MLDIQKIWMAGVDAQKALLQKALETSCPLDAEQLGCDKSEMDSLALPLGFVPVWVPVVDASGLSDKAPGIVSPAIASQYQHRRVLEGIQNAGR